ncbi:MAG: cupin domain-containing protein [Acidimicrobiia bacterium]
MSWTPAPDDHFTGDVWFGEMVEADSPEGLNVLGVLFHPRARTDWHSHPGGQTLYVVAGAGYVVNKAGETSLIGPGDVVHAPPDELHWHGATSSSHLFHLSLTTGGPTEWSSREVTDDQYPA